MKRTRCTPEQIIADLRKVDVLVGQGKTAAEATREIGITETTYIEPGSPWKNGFVESFNARMRDEFLNTMRFDTYKEAKILTRMWGNEYNTIRPHSSLGYKPPAYQAVVA